MQIYQNDSDSFAVMDDIIASPEVGLKNYNVLIPAETLCTVINLILCIFPTESNTFFGRK